MLASQLLILGAETLLYCLGPRDGATQTSQSFNAPATMWVCKLSWCWSPRRAPPQLSHNKFPDSVRFRTDSVAPTAMRPASRTAPTNAVVRASDYFDECCLSTASQRDIDIVNTNAAACRSRGVQHGLLQVSRRLVGPGLRQPHPRHTMDARWLLPAAAAAAAAASSISVCFTILLLSLLQAWRRRGPG